MRVKAVGGDKGGSDRSAFAGMQIRKADRLPHAVKFGRGIQLAHRFAFDPGFGGGDEAGAGWG